MAMSVRSDECNNFVSLLGDGGELSKMLSWRCSDETVRQTVGFRR